MKYGLLFSMALFLQSAFTQEVDSVIIKQVDSLILVSRDLTAKKDFEKALEVIAVAEKLALEKFGHESVAYGSCCFNRGRVNHIKRNYPEAEKWYLEAKYIREKVLGKEHTDYAANLNNLAILYIDLGNYSKAEPLHLETKDIREKVLGKAHPDYANSLNNLAYLYELTKNYNQAETLYLEAKDIWVKVLGVEHVDYAFSLINLGNLYWKMTQFDKAEPPYLEAKAIREKLLGKEHPMYVQSLNSLAGLYTMMGKYEKAEPLYLEAKKIREKVLGKEHLDYAASLNNLAKLYHDMGKYEQAESFYVESKLLFEFKLNNFQHPLYLTCLNNLAILYNDLGKYEQAEPLYLTTMKIREKILGKDHLDYAESLNNLAILSKNMGNFDKAEPLFLEAKAIREKVLGKEHTDYAQSLNNLASIYFSIGNYEKAEPLFFEAKAIRETTHGKQHPEYARSLINIAPFYKNLGNYEMAEDHYLEAQGIMEKTLGREHPQFGICLNNLANLYVLMGNFEKAEPLFREACVLWEKVLGKENPNYPGCLNNLAYLYTNLGNYEKAEPLFLEAKALREKVLGKEHPDFAQTLAGLSTLYESQSRYKESSTLLAEALPASQKRIAGGVSFLSEEELSKYVAKQNGFTQVNAYLLARPSDQTDILPGLSYDQALFQKGFLMQAVSRLQALASSSPQAAEISMNLKAYRRRLASEHAKPIVERKGLKELEEKSNSLEQLLVRTVAGYGDALQQVKWQDVQAALPKEAVALEFVQFQVNFPNKTDSIQYAVLLLRPGLEQPQFIPLFEEKKLIQLLEARHQHKRDYVNNIYAWVERDTMQQMERSPALTKLGGQNQSLYELIWEKIEAMGLKDVKTIFYAPSGILHRINMGAISIDENQRLSDRYQLVSVNSTRQVVTGKTDDSFVKSREAIVYGGIQFEADSTEIVPVKESEYPLVATRSLAAVVEDSTLRGGSWQYLHWTQKEAEVISTTLSKGGLKAEHRSSIHATEEGFKAMGQTNNLSPRVLHIATHGFFFPDPKLKTATSLDDESVFKWSDNPMIRSGLILAGGNYAWKNGKPVSPEKEDGILTAYEISQMNLSNTELVVLSACETGLGDIQGNEGVYGLQRAFKIAGAKYLIMSLWQVPDRETMEFMTTFYKNWLPSEAEALAGKEGKMTIPDAFRKTQREMRDRFYNPYSWAAFVLVE